MHLPDTGLEIPLRKASSENVTLKVFELKQLLVALRVPVDFIGDLIETLRVQQEGYDDRVIKLIAIPYDLYGTTCASTSPHEVMVAGTVHNRINDINIIIHVLVCSTIAYSRLAEAPIHVMLELRNSSTDTLVVITTIPLHTLRSEVEEEEGGLGEAEGEEDQDGINAATINAVSATTHVASNVGGISGDNMGKVLGLSIPLGICILILIIETLLVVLGVLCTKGRGRLCQKLDVQYRQPLRKVRKVVVLSTAAGHL